MFRRKSADAPENPDGPADADASARPAASARPSAERPAAEAGKGRPTPKRREAEAGRYQPIGGSGARRPASPRTPQDKATARSDRARKVEAMKKGEDWALNPKDKGPVRAMVRDYIDSQRRLSEYIMVFLAVLIVGIFFGRNKAVTLYVDIVMLLLLGYLITQGVLLRRKMRVLMAERFPNQSANGLTWYAMSRSMQMRRMRMPGPRLKPGDKF